ncbi:LysM domain-containing protein [Hamadaea sp.]|uniref:LysM peptidoglycan-binding domain-containing protein n=1 Tax=Hamadaea sp. TaxID=2024425 RepID=UPI0025BA9486|nr:LysM domain-containing protein [Hamadaea sp.]
MPVYDPGWPPNDGDAYRVMTDIAKYFPGSPKMKVSSTKRNGSSDYHDFGNAVDFYDAYDGDRGSRNMREFARWLWQWRGYYLELIHSTPFADDNGFYVKRGKSVDAGFYNEPGDHLNHVHLAMSHQAATELLQKLQKTGAPPKKAAAPKKKTATAKKKTAAAPKKTVKNYTVVSGDTLSGIAERHGTTVGELLKLNPSVTDADYIQADWKLRVS